MKLARIMAYFFPTSAAVAMKPGAFPISNTETFKMPPPLLTQHQAVADLALG